MFSGANPPQLRLSTFLQLPLFASLLFEADNYVIPHVLLSDLQGNRNPWYGRVLGLAWGSLIFSGMMNCVYYVQRVRAKLEKSVRAMGRVRKCWK